VLLRDQTIRICIHDDFARPLRWVATKDRQRAIKSQLKPWFSEDHQPRTSGRYFRMQLWGNGARRLLLFDGD
jgi:hypothetical protein